MIGGGSVDDKEPVQLTPEQQQARQEATNFMNLVYTATMAALTDFFAKQQQAARAEAEAQRNVQMQKTLLDKKIIL